MMHQVSKTVILKIKILEEKVCIYLIALLIQIFFFIEVKIMSIPKIAISNEDDSSLQILEARSPQKTNNSSPLLPYKSIIKNRSSQPPTPSSTPTTTHSYYTAPTRLDSYTSNDLSRKSPLKNKLSDQFQIKKQIIDENDTENDISELSQIEDPSKIATSTTEQKIPRRRDTISTISVLNSNENIPKRQYSLRQNRSFTSVNNENPSTSISYNSARNSFIPHVSTPPPPLPYAEKGIRDSLTQISNEKRQNKSKPVRRTNSYRPSSSSSTLRRFIVRNGELLEQEINHTYPILKRRSTFDNSSYPMTQIDTSSIYETPKHEINEQDIQSNIKLVTDTNFNTQSIVNDQSDMQLNVKKENQQSIGVN
jgi:hypothetical protein